MHVFPFAYSTFMVHQRQGDTYEEDLFKEAGEKGRVGTSGKRCQLVVHTQMYF